MTPYAFLYTTLTTIFVRPFNRMKWLFYQASNNPKKGEVGTKGCFTQIALIHISRWFRTIEDFNFDLTKNIASRIDLKLFQLNPQLYEYTFEPDVFIETSGRTLWRFPKRRNPKRSN